MVCCGARRERRRDIMNAPVCILKVGLPALRAQRPLQDGQPRRRCIHGCRAGCATMPLARLACPTLLPAVAVPERRTGRLPTPWVCCWPSDSLQAGNGGSDSRNCSDSWSGSASKQIPNMFEFSREPETPRNTESAHDARKCSTGSRTPSAGVSTARRPNRTEKKSGIKFCREKKHRNEARAASKPCLALWPQAEASGSFSF